MRKARVSDSRLKSKKYLLAGRVDMPESGFLAQTLYSEVHFHQNPKTKTAA